jgi:hypothetical protein
MLDSNFKNNSGPITTANSEIEGRLKVDVGQKRKKIIKKYLKKHHGNK